MHAIVNGITVSSTAITFDLITIIYHFHSIYRRINADEGTQFWQQRFIQKGAVNRNAIVQKIRRIQIKRTLLDTDLFVILNNLLRFHYCSVIMYKLRH